MSASVTTVHDADFTSAVLESSLPVLVDFTAAWCPPCRVMEPVLAVLAAEREDLRVARVDVEADLATAARYGVFAMPTFLLFLDGEPVLRLTGARPARRLRDELDAALAAAVH